MDDLKCLLKVGFRLLCLPFPSATCDRNFDGSLMLTWPPTFETGSERCKEGPEGLCSLPASNQGRDCQLRLVAVRRRKESSGISDNRVRCITS